MKIIKCFLYLLIINHFTPAFSQGIYFEIDYAVINLDFTYAPTGETVLSAKPHNLLVNVGYGISNYLAIEGLLGFNAKSDTLDTYYDDFGYKIAVNTQINSLYGINLVGLLPLNDYFDLSANMGYVKNQAELQYKVDGFGEVYAESYTNSGLSYGIGMRLNIPPDIALTLKYGFLPDVKTDFDFNFETRYISLGYQLQFN